MSQTVYVVQEAGIFGIHVDGVFNTRDEAVEGLWSLKDSYGVPLSNHKDKCEWIYEDTLSCNGGVTVFHITECVVGKVNHAKQVQDSDSILTIGTPSTQGN